MNKTGRQGLISAALLMLTTSALAHDGSHPEDAPPAKPAGQHGGHGEGGHGDGHGKGKHGGHGGHGGHKMPGLLGPYPMSREASGTSWQPDAAEHGGVHGMAGAWHLMGHALVNGVYSYQDGPRGDEKAFVAGMIMGAAHRRFEHGGTFAAKAMLSPDPLMGKTGYPLLLASGETADGVTPLIDRQHPHDLFMELAVSYSMPLGDRQSLFLYAGLPGEPAFGPPAFMHRPSAIDSPEAPISHHWLDSTHITFGVLTAGFVSHDMKLEVSGFRGREPDQDRFDIEEPEIDSLAVRASWNPGPNWSLQASYADAESPEQLEPDEDEKKFSVSALYERPIGDGGRVSFTAAWGRKEHGEEEALNAGLIEGALRLPGEWTLFARGEVAETDELEPGHGEARTVQKISFGGVKDFRVARHALIGVGGLVSQNFVPGALETDYDGDPFGAMVFVRLKVG